MSFHGKCEKIFQGAKIHSLKKTSLTQENDPLIIFPGFEFIWGIKPTKTTQKHVDFVVQQPYTKGIKQQNRLKSRRKDFYAERI